MTNFSEGVHITVVKIAEIIQRIVPGREDDNSQTDEFERLFDEFARRELPDDETIRLLVGETVDEVPDEWRERDQERARQAAALFRSSARPLPELLRSRLAASGLSAAAVESQFGGHAGVATAIERGDAAALLGTDPRQVARFIDLVGIPRNDFVISLGAALHHGPEWVGSPSPRAIVWTTRFLAA